MNWLDNLLIIGLAGLVGFGIATDQWGGAMFFGLILISFAFGPELNRLMYKTEKPKKKNL